MYPYIPATKADKEAMLKVIGLSSMDDLFDDIPKEYLLKDGLKLPNAKSELEVTRYVKALAAENKTAEELTCFLGAGAYDHYISSAVTEIISRSEFYTSYTPYQPEISQGTLQYIFEFQTLITRLTGMDVANASLYDGGTACAEAAIMACATARRKKVVVSGTINPSSMRILKTYCHGQSIELIEVPAKDGLTDINALKAAVEGAKGADGKGEEVAGVLIQSPNFFGLIEDVAAATEIAHSVKKCTMILSTDPFVLPVLKTPGEYGVDVVVGEAQTLGLQLNFGGPYLGIIAAKESYMRKMPGRLVGETVDMDGKRSYVLTLAAREQHIRREKATSNICTNQGLMTLASAIHMCIMGREGMREAAYQALCKAHYAADKITGGGAKGTSGANGAGGVKEAGGAKGTSGKWALLNDGDFFLEFAITSGEGGISGEEACKKLLEKGILAGYPLSKAFPGKKEYENAILIAVTEKRTKEEIDRLAEELEAL